MLPITQNHKKVGGWLQQSFTCVSPSQGCKYGSFGDHPLQEDEADSLAVSYFSTLVSCLVYFAVLLENITLMWQHEAPAQGRTSLTWSILSSLVFAILEQGIW